MYTDMYTVPRFFYFLPLYAFLFGFFAVNSGKSELRDDDKKALVPTKNSKINAQARSLQTRPSEAVSIKELKF